VKSFPARIEGDGPTGRQIAKVGRVRRSTEVDIATHELRKYADAAKDAIDSQALGVALEASLDAELSLLDFARFRAGGSPVAAQLAAEKLNLQKNINNRRIARRFSS
jgi:hypothetical protein